MRIHHLNCGTVCPYGGHIVTGEGGLGGAELVCHCLLIEADDGLILVDTEHPYRVLGVPFKLAFRPRVELGETALEQVRGLGLDPADVRRIAVTHLDLDHAGGLPDFPDAEVNVFAPEHRVATSPSLRDRPRYPAAHIAHGPRWAVHEAGGDEWFGFESIRVMEDAGVDVALIPMLGHSRGHTAVAIRDGDGWLLHCGDAYFHRGQMAEPPTCPSGLRAFQRAMAADNAARLKNTERLRELAREHGDEVRLFCAHDKVELERALSASDRAA